MPIAISACSVNNAISKEIAEQVGTAFDQDDCTFSNPGYRVKDRPCLNSALCVLPSGGHFNDLNFSRQP
jgi:hypothetical protein